MKQEMGAIRLHWASQRPGTYYRDSRGMTAKQQALRAMCRSMVSDACMCAIVILHQEVMPECAVIITSRHRDSRGITAKQQALRAICRSMASDA